METAVLIKVHARYDGKSMKRRSMINKLFRRLYGYETFSNYSKYKKHRIGLIEEIPSIRYDGGIVMVRNLDLKKITDLIEQYGAEYITWTVIPNEDEIVKLQLHSA